MAVLTVQQATTVGIAPTYAAAAGGGDSFPNNGKTFFHVKNASGSPITVTFASQLAAAAVPVGAVKTDVTVSVPATTGDKMVGPFPANSFNDPTSGRVVVTYSAVTSLTVAAVSL